MHLSYRLVSLMSRYVLLGKAGMEGVRLGYSGTIAQLLQSSWVGIAELMGRYCGGIAEQGI